MVLGQGSELLINESLSVLYTAGSLIKERHYEIEIEADIQIEADFQIEADT